MKCHYTHTHSGWSLTNSFTSYSVETSSYVFSLCKLSSFYLLNNKSISYLNNRYQIYNIDWFLNFLNYILRSMRSVGSDGICFGVFLFMCVSFGLHVCLYLILVPGAYIKACRRPCSPWNWHGCEPPCMSWEPNSGPLTILNFSVISLYPWLPFVYNIRPPPMSIDTGYSLWPPFVYNISHTLISRGTGYSPWPPSFCNISYPRVNRYRV